MGSKRLISRCHRKRAARSIAISMKKFMPMPKKKDSRGANWSIVSPLRRAACTYSSPSASVNAHCNTELAPASIMW